MIVFSEMMMYQSRYRCQSWVVKRRRVTAKDVLLMEMAEITKTSPARSNLVAFGKFSGGISSRCMPIPYMVEMMIRIVYTRRQTWCILVSKEEPQKTGKASRTHEQAKTTSSIVKFLLCRCLQTNLRIIRTKETTVNDHKEWTMIGAVLSIMVNEHARGR